MQRSLILQYCCLFTGPFRSPPQSPYAFMLPSIAEQHSHSESPHSHQSPPPPALSFLGQMAMGDMAIGDSAVGDMMPENTAAAHNDVNRGEDVQSGIESFGRSSTSEAGRGGSGDLPRLRKRSAISRLYSSRSPSHIADFQRQRASSHHTASRSYSPRSVASAVLPPSVFPMQVMGGGPIGKTSFSEALFGGGLSPVVGGMSGRNTNAFWQSPGLSGTSFGQGSRSAAHVNMSKKSASASFNAAMFSPSMNSPGFEHSVAQTGIPGPEGILQCSPTGFGVRSASGATTADADAHRSGGMEHHTHQDSEQHMRYQGWITSLQTQIEQAIHTAYMDGLHARHEHGTVHVG